MKLINSYSTLHEVVLIDDIDLYRRSYSQRTKKIKWARIDPNTNEIISWLSNNDISNFKLEEKYLQMKRDNKIENILS